MAENIGSEVAGRVVDSLFAVAKKEIGYMWNCTQNVDTLKRALQDLKGMRERVQGQIDIAIRKGDRLLEGVEKWMKDADEEISKAEEFVEEEANSKKTCFKIAMCGNWHTLHRYGRRATNMATSLLNTKNSGTPYESCVSVETPAPGPLDVYQNKHLDDLHTHNSALGDIIKSLEDESIQITGIYGLGGVGKTTLAMEVAARVKNNLFANVAFTTVSQNVDVGKIKTDIGDATKRIMKGDKILIILDDVWEKLNLEDLCIPCGNDYKNCKILLTSRSEKVCQQMNAQSRICVNTLRTKEANSKKTCFKIAMCGNWHTLHRYGRRATNMATSLLNTKNSGTPYESCVSVETPAPGPLDVYQNKHLDDLHTHNSALGDIIKSLEDESIQITGIYGLGGVGKTTLAMEVAARVKNNLFANVAFTTVSQNVDVGKIKTDIGDATKRIMKGDKILIILDDVWEKLNLEDLCIPCGNDYKNCKILLTSRSEKVCQQMNAQSRICVNTLRTKEAWTLFKCVVGERLETDSNLKPVALKVVEECGGLPLLIQAVGNALKDESIESWESALTQLQKHAPSNIDDEIRKSFTHLKLSYDYLKSEEAKSCFLLCSLWAEDDDISLKDLVIYLVGIEKFDDLDSIWDARSRVQNAVNILTSSGLLLNSKREGWTKMHDIVRDVALLIASQGNNKFLVKAQQGLIEWLPRNLNLESYTGISLKHNDIIKLPDYRVNVPHLEIFLVSANPNLSIISDEFIGCMKKVKVLDISWNNISSLPPSFQLLTKLRTLNLRENRFLREISILGELKDLEILILSRTGITEIPKEIAQLVKLRVLEFRECDNLSLIAHGVISALWRLEELCIDLCGMSEGVDGCIIEVMKLSKLTYLDLAVKSFDLFPEGFNSKNLKGFVVQIGTIYLGHPTLRSDRYLIISGVHLVNSLVQWSNKLIEGSHPSILLFGIDNLNNIIPAFYHQGLKHIRIEKCDDVSCLLDDGTSSDWDEGKTKEKFFKELKTLN